jgi:CSLREA domain-containing protein
LWLAARNSAGADYPDGGFSDVSTNHLFHNEISWLAITGLGSGFANGTFRPSATVTRGGTAAFLYRMFGLLYTDSTEYEVNTAIDGNDAAPGDLVCEVTYGAGDCSLRAAITESNLTAFDDEVSIAPGVDPVLSIPGVNEDQNVSGDLDVQDALYIHGNGATIDAAGVDRVISAHHYFLDDDESGLLALDDLTVTGGAVSAAEASTVPFAAGITGGPLVDVETEEVTVEGNDSESAPDNGAVVASGVVGGESAVLQSSLVTDNVGGPSQYAVAGSYVAINDSVVADNTGTAGAHGSPHSLSAHGSTVSGHDGPGLSGEVWRVRDSAIVDNTVGVSTGSRAAVLMNSTVSAESSALVGAGPVSVRSATLVTTGGDPTVEVLDTGSLAWVASIIAGPVSTDRCVFPVAYAPTSSWNLATDASCGLTGPGDQPSTDPLLGPLADNGGPTPTLLPAETSPALDVVTPGTAGVCDAMLATDQRGRPRPYGLGCDVGAVEAAVAPPIVVNTSVDGDDVAPGNGLCEMTAGTGDCSLRAAISETNADADVDELAIASGVDPVLTIAGQGERQNATGDLNVVDSLVVEGNGATVDGNDLDRVIYGFDDSGDDFVLELHDLVVTGGKLPGGRGGGILVEGALVLEGSEVRENDTSSPTPSPVDEGSGVLIESYEEPHSYLRDSLITENVSSADDAALVAEGVQLHFEDTQVVDNESSTGSSDAIVLFEGSVSVQRLQVSGHSGDAVVMSDVAPGDFVDSALVDNGGGIGSDNSSVDLVNTTVSSESTALSSVVGGPTVTASTLVTTSSDPTVQIVDEGVFQVAGSIIAGPPGSPRCAIVGGEDDVWSGGWNIATDDSCGLDQPGDLESTDPLLGALADHGGSTLTYLISAISDAVDAIPLGTAGLCDGTLAADQRGLARPSGAGCDIGAVERQPGD